MSEITFVPLPYGTGNDLCNSLGWGKNEGPWGNSIEKLVLTLINEGKKDFISLWDVSVFAGKVIRLDGSNQYPIFTKKKESEKW